MKNKLIVIAGQTGVGKTDIAFQLANKLKSEIVLVDSIQAYNEVSICSNKPPTKYTENVKYHNLNTFNIENDHIYTNGSVFAHNTRNIIQSIWDKGKIPVLEGGCGFYLKMILTGAGSKFNIEEESKLQEFTQIARSIIKYDNSFETTFKRLSELDKSLPSDAINENDSYRLEKRLTEALLFGDGAYRIIKEREIDTRKVNKLEADIYSFFLYCNKNNLRLKLESRCQEMIKNGLFKEVSDLLSKDLKPNNNLLLNAYGLNETIELYTKIVKLLPEKSDYLKAIDDNFNKKDKKKLNFHKNIEKIFYNYLIEFSTNNRQYAKSQATWFKKNDNYHWINSEESQDKIVTIIENYVKNYTYEEFLKIPNEDKEKIFNYKTMEYSPKFEIMKNTQIYKKIIEDAFNYAEKHKLVLLSMEKAQQNKDDQVTQINKETLQKYFKI